MKRSSTLKSAAPKAREGRPPAETDAELMQRLAAGDLAALGTLYDRYHEDVRRFVLRATGHPADSADITHEVFLTLSRAATTYDGRASARPFLLGVAAQLVKRRGSAISRVRRALGSLASTLAHGSARSPEEALVHAHDFADFEAALARLSEEKRIAFLLVEGEGLSGEEVAQALQIPVKTVWTRLHYARADLRAAISKGRRPPR